MPEFPGLSEHIEKCPSCRFVVAQLRSEFTAVGRAWSALPATGVIILSIWREDLEGEPTPSHLAAQGNDKSRSTTSMTLASADQRLLLKVVRDSHTNEVWLYLMSDDPALCRNVLIKPFGHEREYLTDPEGRINLGMVPWPATDMYTAEVHVAKADFTLSPWTGYSDQQVSSMLTSPAGDQIRVTLSDGERNMKVEIEVLKLVQMLEGIPLKVAVREGKVSEITLVSAAPSQRATVQNMNATEPIEIFLFQ